MWAHATARQTSVFGHCFHTVLSSLILQNGFLFLLSYWYYTICSYSFHWRDFSSYSSQSIFSLDKFSRKAGCSQWKVITALPSLLGQHFFVVYSSFIHNCQKTEITHMTTNRLRKAEWVHWWKWASNQCMSKRKQKCYSFSHVQLFAAHGL